MVEAHKILANMISLYSLVLGAWGLFNFLRKSAPDGNFNGALVLAVGLYVVQGIVGMVLVFMGLMPPRIVHFLYGVAIAITIPGIFAFTRGRNTSRESLLYGLGLIFIWGMADRADVTGH